MGKNGSLERQAAIRDAEIAFLTQREIEEQETLEHRYTDDDLVFAGRCGYESRKRQELEETTE